MVFELENINNKKASFDKQLKKNVDNDDIFGYAVLPNEDREYPEHVYKEYYSKRTFSEFCEEMKDKYKDIYVAYAKGKGSELVGAPPKMASVASSSRFCYLALRDASIDVFGENSGKKFEFEKNLPVCEIKGTNPQMDAFCDGESADYFFEFKCHELFDVHEKEISEQYNIFFKQWDIKREEGDPTIPTKQFGLDKIKLFDLKQFITHLTGILCYDSKKPKIFSYVYFKPVKGGFDGYYKELEEEIKKVFSTVCNNGKIVSADSPLEFRLYFFESDVMKGFEGDTKPTLVFSYPQKL